MSRTGLSSAESGTPRESDQDLVTRAGRGDHAAFESLYFRYRDWVANLAWRLTADRELSLDILQETFAYLVRRLPTLRLDGRLTTFLYPAVKHLAIDLQKRQTRSIAQHAEPPTPARAAPDDQPGLRRAVDALPEGQREVILMRFVSEMSLAEIAAALEIPIGTVKSRLHLALRQLSDRVPHGS